MSKPQNGNRRCPNCRHYFAAHGYEIGTDRRPCVVSGCNCCELKKEEQMSRGKDGAGRKRR